METNKFKIVILAFAVALIHVTAYSQKNPDPIKIDRNGRMLWKSNNQEAFFWGVNYSTPFAHGFRQMGRLGEDIEKNIDIDTYHLSRLGTTAYRIHVWACEISDTLGNLLDNEHLKLLDYLINRLQQRGVYIFLTPIRYGGPGYPEPDTKTPGFADKYPKSSMYLIPEAIAAQERYLKQFVNHVNPYNGKSYKSDPMIVGFEICNEPAHSKPAETTAFVKRMINAVKSTGCTKPVFYNVTQNISLLEDFIKGGTDGVTFQWYPSGLVANHEVMGNFLPHVDEYSMPFKNEKYFLSQARLVYEFDAADVGRSYLYPPIALSYKEAGMQWVTMFAYDPVALAPSNTEYQTHFLNMVYSPQKAIGFKIAGELFRKPQYKRDRENETKPFDIKGLKISYKDDFSELATNELFFHTNTTSTNPPDVSSLKSIAGYGSSPIISYKGYGAYLLDKISDGVWRLEVMPDAIWVRDPFSKATPGIENVVIKWIKYEMGINLPDLGKGFSVTGINEGNKYSATAKDGKFDITPGAYILSTKPVTEDIRKAKIGVITANEYFAPKETNRNLYFLPSAPAQVSEGQPVEVYVRIVSPETPIKKLILQSYIVGYRGAIVPSYRPISFEKTDEYRYKAIIPDSLVKPGILTYNIIVESATGKTTVYPGGIEGPTTDWKYFNPDSYTIRVLPSKDEVQLVDPEISTQLVTFFGNSRLESSLVPSGTKGRSIMKFSPLTGGSAQGRPNTSGMAYVVQNFIGDIIKGIAGSTAKYNQVVIYGKVTGKPLKIEVSLINRDGNAYTAETSLSTDKDKQIINLQDLKEGNLFLLPRPYPVFLPYWYTTKFKKPFSLAEIERIQLLVPVEGNEELPAFELTSISLK
jgi:hypothetical protein